MKLDAYLEAHDLTLEAFGARVGVSHSTVLRWAAGKSAPRGRETLRRIAAATGGAVTASDFFPDAVARMPGPGLAEARSPLAAEATQLGLDPDAIAEATLRKAISEERARRWAEENRAAIEAYNRHFEENDTPLAEYRAF